MPKITHSPEEKAKAVVMNLQDGVPVSEICKQFHIQPTVFYQWRKMLLESASFIFAGADRKLQKAYEHAISNYQETIRRKDHVIAELLEEHTALKKKIGGN